jgi:hypothetical protein
MSCRHENARVLRESCFVGPVGDNPAAHGGIRVEVECLDCGARRAENHNGRHREIGAWWDRAGEVEVLRAAMERARARARQLGSREVRRGNTAVEVCIGDDGLLRLVAKRGLFSSTDEAAIVRASGLVEEATVLRRAVLALESI